MNAAADTSVQPDVAWPMWPATSAAAVCACVAGAGLLSGHPVVALIAVGVTMLMVAYGWVRLLQLPSPRGTTSMLIAAAIILPVGGLLTRAVHISMLIAAIAVALVLEFVHQLGRQDRRPRLVESVSSSVFGITVLASGASLLPLDGTVGRASSLVVLTSVLASTLTDVTLNRAPSQTDPASGYVRKPGRRALSALTSLVLGAIAGGVVWHFIAPADVRYGLPLALASGAVAALVSFTARLAFSGLPTIGGFRARWAAGAASVLVTGVVAYAQAWIALGSLDALLFWP